MLRILLTRVFAWDPRVVQPSKFSAEGQRYFQKYLKVALIGSLIVPVCCFVGTDDDQSAVFGTLLFLVLVWLYCLYQGLIGGALRSGDEMHAIARSIDNRVTAAAGAWAATRMIQNHQRSVAQLAAAQREADQERLAQQIAAAQAQQVHQALGNSALPGWLPPQQ